MHIKLKGSPAICLVGFMGCGKTTVGRLLAARLGWTFVDLDEEIERVAAISIAQIFAHDGESHFRRLESDALGEQLTLAVQGKARVIALGGGAFLDPGNRGRLELGGLSIWLECPLDRLWARVGSMSHRPLARDRAEFERLYQQRLDSYRLADFTVGADTDRPEQVVEAIVKLPLF